VVFTTVLALFGKAQPFLWVVISRAGFVVMVLMTGKVTARITLWLTAEQRPPRFRGARWVERVGAGGPAILAALIAMLTVALGSGWISDAALGYSEALAAAFLVIGLERHIDGHYRQAFVCGFVAALDRPEIWVFWGPYGLWLMWKDPGSRALVISLAILCLALWFVPQKWGGGSFFSGVTRATHVRPNSNALKSCPFCSEITAAWTLSIFRVKMAAAVLILGGIGLALYHRRTRHAPEPRIRLTPLQRRALGLAVTSGLFGYAWWALIALETQAGFSGNSRYLTVGLPFLNLAGGFCFAGCAVLLATLPQRWVPAERERLGLAARLALGTAVLTAFFAFFPNWVGSNYINLPAFHRSLVYQATLRQDVRYLIRTHGGPKGLQNCGAGHIMVEGFQVPMLAYYMGERIDEIEAPPETTSSGLSLPLGAPWPNVILQDRDTGSAALLPLWQTINGWMHQGAHYKIMTTKEIRFFEDCAPQPNDQKAPTAS
jgi:hypothetical protein